MPPRADRRRVAVATPLVAASALALMALAAPAVSHAAPLGYFAVGPDVYRAVLDGNSPAELVTGTTDSLAIRGIALDPARGRLFTSRSLNPAIEVAPLTPGGSLSSLGVASPGLNNPGGISIDPGAGRIYWGTEGATNNTGNLLTADMTGAGTTTIGTPGTGDKRVMGLAVDPATRNIWWAQYTPNPAIHWTRTDGSARGTLDTTGATVNVPRAIAISHRSGRAYWASFLNIGSASLSGGAGFDIPSAMFPGGVAVDDSAGHLYWMEAVGFPCVVGIRRADLDGQGVVSVTPSGLPSDGVTALALLFPPVQAETAVTGSAVVGSALTCTATWQGDSPEAFAFRAPASTSMRWLRDGTAIEGATAATHVVASAGRYACQGVATNAAGTTVATSDAIAVPAPGAAGGVPAGGAPVPALRATWATGGGRVRTSFTAPKGATRFTITAVPGATRTTAISREHTRAAKGRCTTTGPRRRRSVACSITLTRRTWSVTTTAWAASTALARTTRTIRVR